MQEKYLKQIVYGSIDGIITTFAVVSGVVGASLSPAIIIILGLANLFADGFSMAAGNFLSTKSKKEQIEEARKEHRQNISENPDKEREELKQTLSKKGLKGDALNSLIEQITTNKKVWENFLVSSEYGEYGETEPKKTALATFSSFIVAGFIPLLAFVVDALFGVLNGNAFIVSSVLTGIALFSVGTLKASIVEKGPIRGGFETLLIGGLAATVAFAVGYFLKGLA